MTNTPFRILLCIVAALALSMASAQAQDDPPALAEVWLLTPKSGHGEAFWEGMEKHMAFRAEKGDPWTWNLYTPLLGDNLGQVGIRACCVTWADLDSYAAWRRGQPDVGKHFREHVAPHVEGMEHFYENIDWENSHWPAGDRAFPLYAVTEFSIEAGQAAAFNATREKMSQIAIDQGWANDERNWLWMTRVGGSSTVSVVIPHPDFASFDAADDSFFRFLSEQLGSEEAAAKLYADFDEATSGSHFQIWVRESMSDDSGE